ncbi:MAG: hypothetical protein MI744_11420 [Pseudomonadales bacterium]|nr:hypothetical protein [Pseudomonadales bacterium]
MEKMKRWRRVWAVLAFVGVVVMVLNIETLTTYLGLDRALVCAIEAAPSWLSWIINAVLSLPTLVGAIAVVAYGAGLWSEYFFRRFEMSLNKQPDFEALAETCFKYAHAARESASVFDLGIEFHSRLPMKIDRLRFDLWRHFHIYPETEIASSTQAIEVAKTLDEIGALLHRKDVSGLQTKYPAGQTGIDAEPSAETH